MRSGLYPQRPKSGQRDTEDFETLTRLDLDRFRQSLTCLKRSATRSSRGALASFKSMVSGRSESPSRLGEAHPQSNLHVFGRVFCLKTMASRKSTASVCPLLRWRFRAQPSLADIADP